MLSRRTLNKYVVKGRRTIRLKDYNYSWPGFYFVTICVKDKGCYLGKIVEVDNFSDGPTVRLTKLGEIVRDIWRSIPKHHPKIELDEFIIMPNHIHGIVVISENTVGAIQVGAIHESPLQNRRQMLLSKIIGRFKMNSAKEINTLLNNEEQSFWQRNYYEHIIRNETSLEKIRNYIIDNPRKWYDDIENPNNKFNKKQASEYYKNLFK